ncbi:MAG: maleylpyruvate isomerase N-terminal domain-containing protein [Nocardioides sp.]
MRPSLITSSGSEVERFVAAAERFAIDIADADLGAPVPACPGWTTYDLAVHLGNVHAWAATIVETGRPAAEQNDTPGHRRPRTVSAWYAGKAEDLYEVLRATDPARPCWNFAYGDGQASFWARRQMHEATVHLMDLSAATGRDLAVDPELAADGVDEVLTVFGHRMHHRGFPATLTAPLCLVATDTGDAWTVTPRPVVPAPYAGVPTQVRGSTSESAPALTEGPPLVVPRRHPSADRVEATAETLYRCCGGASRTQITPMSP